MTEKKNQQRKQEKEWSKEEFFQEMTKRMTALEKMMKHSKPVRPWKGLALIVLPFAVYWLIYIFIRAKGIEVSFLFSTGGMTIAFLISLLFNYMLRVQGMQRSLNIAMRLADMLSFFITVKVKKPLEKEKKETRP